MKRIPVDTESSRFTRALASVALVALVSGRFHLVWLAIVAGPMGVLAAFLAFPYLGPWLYRVWFAANFFCLLLAIAGMGAWAAQSLHARRAGPWLPLVLLPALAVGACRQFGFDMWYWAFTRGFFLN